MSSKVHIAPKSRENRESAPLEWFCTLFERKATNKYLAGTIFRGNLLLVLEENAIFGLFWQGFCPSFSILRIAAGAGCALTPHAFRV